MMMNNLVKVRGAVQTHSRTIRDSVLPKRAPLSTSSAASKASAAPFRARPQTSLKQSSSRQQHGSGRNSHTASSVGAGAAGVLGVLAYVATDNAACEPIEPSSPLGQALNLDANNDPQQTQQPQVHKRKTRQQKLKNPGPAECASMLNEIFVETYAGGKFHVSKGIFPGNEQKQMQMTGGFHFGDPEAPQNHVVDFQCQMSMGPSHPLVYTRVDLSQGLVQGRWHSVLHPRLNMKTSFALSGAVNPRVANFEAALDYKGDDFSTVVKGSLQGGTPVVQAVHLQAVTNKLAVGADVQAAVAGAKMGRSMLTVNARYKDMAMDAMSGETWLLSAVPFDMPQINLLYQRKVNEKLTCSVLGLMDVKQRQSLVSAMLGMNGVMYSFNYLVNSQGLVQANLRKMITPFMSLSLTGELDHAQNTSKAGVGLEVNF